VVNSKIQEISVVNSKIQEISVVNSKIQEINVVNSNDKGFGIKLDSNEKISNSQEFATILKSKFKFTLQEKDGKYTKDTIRTVHQTFYNLKFRDFVTLNTKYRKIRRNYLHDMDEYVMCGLEYLKSLSNMFQDDFKKLYEYNVIDSHKWDLSCSTNSSKDSDVNEWMFNAIDEFDTKLPSRKTVKKDDYFRIMAKGKEVLGKEIKDLDNQKNYIKMTGHLVGYLIIVIAKCSDHTYKLFNVENEDLFKFAESENDPKVKLTVKEIQKGVEELTGIIGNKINKALLS